MVGINRNTWVLNPDANSTDQMEMFKFFGKLMGIAARSKLFMDLFLAPIVWKLIVKEPVTLDDYRGIDTLGASFIEKMREGCAEDRFVEETFDTDYGWMNFTATSLGGAEVELHTGGRKEYLTWSNRLQYCDEIEKFHLNEMCDAAAAINEGLCTQIPETVICFLAGEDLEQLVCGVADVDINLLKSATDYGGYFCNDPVIALFWETLTEFSQDDRRAFLRFCWGRSRLPLNVTDFPQRMQVCRLQRYSISTLLLVLLTVTCVFFMYQPGPIQINRYRCHIHASSN